MNRDKQIQFYIEWLGPDRQVIDTDVIFRYDLTAAIRFAANKCYAGRNHAHGFFVRKAGTE